MNPRPSLVLLSVIALFASTADARRGHHFKGPTGVYTGVIAAVAGNTLRVDVGERKNGQEKIIIFSTDPKTTISDGEKTETLADLKQGQTVTVKSKNGWAHSVRVRHPGDENPESKNKDPDKDAK